MSQTVPLPEARTATVNQAAAELGVSRDLVRKLVASGELPSFKLGHKRLIPRAAIEALLATQQGEGVTHDRQ